MIWLNGTIKKTPTLSHNDRGFLLGDGAFTTLLSQEGTPLWLEDHLKRLYKDCATIGITPPYSEQELALAAKTLTQKGSEVLRISISRGEGGRGLAITKKQKPTTLITKTKAPEPPPSYTAITSHITRHTQSPLSYIKSLSYLEAVLARKEATENHCDEALLYNEKQNAASMTAGNFFIIIDEQCYTPPISEGILAGITRNKLLQSLPIKEQPITPPMLKKMQACFCTNSVMGVIPITKLDGNPMGKTPWITQAKQALQDEGWN